MTQRPYLLAAALVAFIVALGAGGLYWASQRTSGVPVALPAASAPPSAPAPAAVAAAPPSAAAVHHPIESVAPPSSPPVLAEDASLEDRLIALFGRKEVLSRLQLDGFVQRLVATVDNLPREQAAARLWPVTPTDGRFQVQRVNGEEVMSPDNGLRYTPYVVMLERVDLRRLAGLYRQLYPSLQAAYVELGHPDGYFNDRMVAVIDHLLAAPEPAGLVGVRLAEVKGPVQPARPWVMYEFTDPALEARSSGHKIMLRMGPVNERRVKARLRELRSLLATTTASGDQRPGTTP
jgi:hypothetical protein